MARNFTGGLNEISLGDVLDIADYTDFTVACFFLVDTFDISWQTMFAKGDSSWRLSRSSSNNTCVASHGLFPNESKITPVENINDGNLHHACFTWDQSLTLFEFFLDGVSKGTDNTNDSAINNTYNAKIGANDEPSPERNFKGDLSEFVFWDTILSATQILSLSKGSPPGIIESANLLAYLPIFGSFSPEQDWSGTGKTGTVTGTTKTAHAPVELLENYL